MGERYRLNHVIVVKLYHPYTQFSRYNDALVEVVTFTCLIHWWVSCYVRCPYLPWQHWCFFHFARILNGFRRNSRKSLSVTNELITILGEIVSGTKEQVHDMTENSNRRQTGGATQRMTSQISQYIYGTIRPQNWRVHYPHTAAEASYNRARSLAL